MPDARIPTGLTIVFALVAGMLMPGGPAHAQDSFVRVADGETGRPVLSILGTGVGQPYAALVVDLGCPTAATWTVDVVGPEFRPGAPISLGFGDVRGGWHAVALRDARLEPDGRLRLGIDRASFRAAILAARGDEASSPGADAMLMIGEGLGVSVALDGLVREMSAFARDCEAPRRNPPQQAAPRAAPGRVAQAR
ncbi:hypothetical protein J5Y09_19085 [Roseomonas sp. PWR1]|uniref:Uncharacterized protein n=1 Tax=Roseomonas nitratireducens TaxID=2820810 RepID=A0ABS4AXG1_9PROT|nr:hypothetical protein [Neoroseomonas nitratireducens]MBP0466039.1 hypothetical protein [Neoroseomonas nitratireducens]